MEMFNKICGIISIVAMCIFALMLMGVVLSALFRWIEKAYDRRKIKTAVKDWLEQEPTNQFEAELCKEVVIEKLKDLNTLDFSNEILVEKYTNLIIQGTTLYQMECEDHKRIVRESWDKVFGNSNEN
jgi:hypothetical protein